MSGRAGRRGLDDKGIVILMVDEKMSPSVGKQIIKVGFLFFFKILLLTSNSVFSNEHFYSRHTSRDIGVTYKLDMHRIILCIFSCVFNH